MDLKGTLSSFEAFSVKKNLQKTNKSIQILGNVAFRQSTEKFSKGELVIQFM